MHGNQTSASQVTQKHYCQSQLVLHSPQVSIPPSISLPLLSFLFLCSLFSSFAHSLCPLSVFLLFFLLFLSLFLFFFNLYSFFLLLLPLTLFMLFTMLFFEHSSVGMHDVPKCAVATGQTLQSSSWVAGIYWRSVGPTCLVIAMHTELKKRLTPPSAFCPLCVLM